MPGTGRTVAEFLALGIWVALLLFVARLTFDYVAMYFPNPFTVGMLSIVGGAPIISPALVPAKAA